MSFDAIYVPSDDNQPIVKTTLDDLHRIDRLVGGVAGRATYDRDCVLSVEGNGVARGLAPNLSASAYAMQESEAGQLYAERNDGVPPDIQLYGNAVITGPELTDVPDRLVAWLGATRTAEFEALTRSRRHGFKP